MKMRKEFYYLSQDGVTRIHAAAWIPDGRIRAVLQICHGMVEYIERYGEFAEYLASKGYCVAGNDHLGHGKSVRDEEQFGYFAEKDGNRCVIEDIHWLRKQLEKAYPDVPLFMLGHSMGSFLLRQYLVQYGEGLAGAVIMGTGHHGNVELAAGQALCRLIAGVKGWHHRSRLVNQLGMGSYNRHFRPGESDSDKDWITSDTQRRRAYENDPLCSFIFTVNGYYWMFEGMKTLTKKKRIEKIPKDIPLLLVSGGEDPVGGFGKGVGKVYRRYLACGLRNVTMKLYPGDRHEILNERDRRQVYEDIYAWMETQRGEQRC